jgi:hypothetical protein
VSGGRRGNGLGLAFFLILVTIILLLMASGGEMCLEDSQGECVSWEWPK